MLWKYWCYYFYGRVFLFISGIWGLKGLELLGYRRCLCLTLIEITRCFPKRFYRFALPAAKCKTCFAYPTLPCVFQFFTFTQSNKCVVSNCSFNLHFAGGSWLKGCFDIFIDHLHIFLCKISVQVVAHCFNWIALSYSWIFEVWKIYL